MKKKILLLLLCVTTLLMSGCGDKFAKEKEAIAKAEKAAMATQLPVVEKPDFSKLPKPTPQERQNIWKKYSEDLSKFVAAEEKILAEMQKSDVQIAEMEKKAESDSDKKGLQEFKDKVKKDRVEFVRKISKGRLEGDTFIVGVGSTWQEVEMVYGKPKNEQKKYVGTKAYEYDGIVFEDHIGGGVPPKEVIMKWKSKGVQSVCLTGGNITSDAGIKIGMPRDEVIKVLKSKYVKKRDYQQDELFTGKGFDPATKNISDVIVAFSMQETLPYNMFIDYEDGKLTRYMVAPY